ncbi:MAG TPA: PEP-CTERM sorting domain-containing protein [Planctomycetota bacterium]|nr:PEP-CTERM sorting domain-containing protein [Planctomycetota bacterium]
MLTLLGLAACLLLPGNAALATPVISIDTLPEWSDALGGGGGGGGYIEAVEADTFKAMIDDGLPGEWPEPYETAIFCTPHLYVMEHADGGGREEPALVMSWGDQVATGQDPPQLGDRVAAAWDFVYTEDPPFSSSNWIEFSIHAPFPGMYVSVNLIGEGGLSYREWIWLVGDPQDPTRIPACIWTDVIINPVTGASNYAYEKYFEHGELDFNNIERIRFDENGIWSPEFQQGDPSGLGLVWNAWDHVAVNPEPATMLLLGGGLLALARRRRRRKSPC